MRVVVTGGAGYLGSVLCLQLLEAGCSVGVLDRLVYGGGPLLPIAGRRGFRLFHGDIRDEAVIERCLDGADALVHLAAVVGDPACAREPELAVAVNREGSMRLIAACKRHGVRRFVFASTCSNYGQMADTSLLAEEDHELRPVSLYANTKVVVERHLLSTETGAMCPVVYRFATLYGLSPRMRFDLTVNEFTMEMAKKGQLTVFGEQFWRPYVHVRDAARAIVAGLTAPSDAVYRQVFNIGSSAENHRKIDIVSMIQERLRSKAKIKIVTKAEDPRNYKVSFDKVKRILGFDPLYRVEDGIEEILTALKHGIINPEGEHYYNVARSAPRVGVGKRSRLPPGQMTPGGPLPNGPHASGR
jgi:nucleoside-diphosphate-sugar epimerase